MQQIIKHYLKSDLVIVPIYKGINNLALSKMPTVCLIIANRLPEEAYLSLLINDIIEIGCKFFVLWGDVADELHDVIDIIIEEGKEEWLDIVTTSHKEETISDIIWFTLNATYFGSDKFRCLAIVDESDKKHLNFISNLIKENDKI